MLNNTTRFGAQQIAISKFEARSETNQAVEPTTLFRFDPNSSLTSTPTSHMEKKHDGQCKIRL